MKRSPKSEIRDRTTQETDTTVSMPKSERSDREDRNPNAEIRNKPEAPEGGSDFEFRNSFVIRHSSFVIVSAFTLIELLIVIGIIGILAALIFPITGAVTRARMKSVATSELSQIETFIESYKANRGTYPPDCIAVGSTPAIPIYVNQLYYELLGTTLDNAGVYTTKDGSSQIAAAALPTIFGAGIDGFVNSTKGTGGEEGTIATQFMKGLKPAQIGSNSTGIKILVCSVPWPKDNSWQPSGVAGSGQNPWRYISSNPTNNPNSFDLWVDLVINGKTNRISNWGQPKVVGTP